MTVSAKAFGQFPLTALSKEIGLLTDEIKVMLCTSAYSPDQDNHVYKSSVTGEVANGNGYATGGITLVNKTLTYDAASNTVKFHNTVHPSWPNSTIVARYAVFYNNSGATDATRPLISYVDFGVDTSSSASEFKITLDANGIVTLTASAS